jgi:hypothetical protein
MCLFATVGEEQTVSTLRKREKRQLDEKPKLQRSTNGVTALLTKERGCEKRSFSFERDNTDTPLDLLHNQELHHCCLHAEEDNALHLKNRVLLGPFRKEGVCI